MHLARGRRLEAHENLGEGRLAASRLADDGDGLGLPGVESHPFVRLELARPAAPEEGRKGRVLDLVDLPHPVDLENRLADGDGCESGVAFALLAGNLLPTAAADMVMAFDDGCHRDRCGATGRLPEEVAPRPEEAPLRALVGKRQLAWNGLERPCPAVGPGQRNGPHEALAVGVLHGAEDPVDIAVLDGDPGVHHGRPGTGLHDETEIVRDVEHRHVVVPGNVGDEFDDPRFHGDVESRCRFVEKQQVRSGQQRHGDDHALLLSAGHLVHVGSHDAVGIGKLHPLQHVARPFPGFAFVDGLVVERHLGELPARGEAGIEGVRRLLVDHGDLVATQPSEVFVVEGGKVASLEEDPATDHAPVVAEVAQDGERDRGLAAPGLADEADALALEELQVEVDHGGDFLPAREVGDAEILAFQDGHVGGPGHVS